MKVISERGRRHAPARPLYRPHRTSILIGALRRCEYHGRSPVHLLAQQCRFALVNARANSGMGSWRTHDLHTESLNLVVMDWHKLVCMLVS
jgi:hypothetical protein